MEAATTKKPLPNQERVFSVYIMLFFGGEHDMRPLISLVTLMSIFFGVATDKIDSKSQLFLPSLVKLVEMASERPKKN